VLSHKWERGFCNREGLKKMTPRNMSLQRAMASGAKTVDTFFEKYKKLREENNINSRNIWNIDETGMDTIPVNPKVIGVKGQQAQMIVSGERGTRTSVATFISSGGESFNPMVIHQGINVQPAWFTYAMEDTYIRCSDNGYMSKVLFLEYTDLFLDWLEEEGRLDDQKHILLLDGHSTHTYNFPAMQAFEEVGVEVLLLPPHTTHYLQPLDKNPFSLLKHYWNHYLDKYNREHAGLHLNKVDFFQVFNLAWNKAITPHNIRLGFIRTGIEPLDRSKITPEMLQIHEAYESKRNMFNSGSLCCLLVDCWLNVGWVVGVGGC
jgi:hypothetical protein